MTAVDPQASKICLSCEGVSATDADRCPHCAAPLLPLSSVHFPNRRGEVDAGNPLVGSVVGGKFVLKGVLGKGGMGTVFRASHAVSLAPVAVKLLHPRWSSRAEFRRSLLAEARKAGRVVHEHCARVLDVGEAEDGTVYLAMELADGEPVDALVRRGGAAPSIAVDILAQVARALVAIHAAGLVHRDLSSRNVLVAWRSGAPFVKVLDFGIAQTARLPVGGKSDEGGDATFANPVFSAPEQLAGGEVDARADLYSLGVLAFLLLTGRLPVAERDPRAAARRTVAGELDVLPSQKGVPRALQSFVARCLSRDPSLRPKSAEAALLELDAIRGGGRKWLPTVSLAVAAVAAALLIVAFARATPPFLRVVGGALVLREGVPSSEEPVRYLKPQSLLSVRALYGGFAPSRLELEVTKGNTLQWRTRLQPEIAAEGVLVLTQAQPQWRDALVRLELACADGPVDCAFVVPGAALLGSARLCVDETPPIVQASIAANGSSGVRVHAATRAQVSVRDASGLASLQATCAFKDGSAHEVALPLDAMSDMGGEFHLASVFRSALPASRERGSGTFTVVAMDRAGNRGASLPIEFTSFDFGAPAIEVIGGPDGESSIPYLESKAVIRARLSFDEPDLKVEVRDDAGRLRGSGPLRSRSGSWHELDLLAAEDGEAFAPGLFAFVVVDAAGNRTEQTLPLSFRSRRLDVVFVASADGGVVALDKELACGARGGSVAFTCGASFLPVSASLRAIGSPSDMAVELRAEPPRWRVQVPPLEPGRYELSLELEERGGRALGAVVHALPLQALPDALQFRMPAIQSRFLPELLRANLLRMEGGALLAGAGVAIDGGLSRFVRGALWHGPSPDALVAMPLVEGSGDAGSLLPRLPLLRGRNVLRLELRDVLGRPLATDAIDARTVGDAALRRLFEFADFVDDPTPPRPSGDEFAVEHGQPVRLLVRSAIPFLAAELSLLQLSLQGVEFPAASVRADGSGSEIAFVLPFAQWSRAAGMFDLARADYAQGRASTMTAQFRSPAGAYAIEFRLRSARSTLAAVKLSELARGDVPGALSDVTLLPVLAPDGGEWPDPCANDEQNRGLYRQRFSVSVRGMADWFVQDREVTLGQYAALMAVADGAPIQLVVHRDDPLGRARATRRGMLPHGYGDSDAAFLLAAEKDPNAAVAGVDFFQAYAATRIWGHALAGDPALFRLPLGCELELAAFGLGPVSTARHGAAARGGSVSASEWARLTAASAPGRGVDAAALDALGDRVAAAVGGDVRGLDFGVREWVLDLPHGPDAGSETLVREWISDRELHVQRALELSGARPAPADQEARLLPELRARLSTFGVVRGLAIGDRVGALDADGRRLDLATGSLPASVPGVLRAEQMRRDGRDLLPGRWDPRLLVTGFRLAGGSVFVQRVRNP
ncbi:MAG: hypothetical protein RLZZ562_1351 [Planctomycetota bacterium]|jgi:hypothetical protein